MKLWKIATTGAVATVLSAGLAAPAIAAKCPSGSLNQSYEHNVAECNIEKNEVRDGQNDLLTIITNIINVVLGVIGLIAVVMIIVGGVFYATANGDPSKAKKARDTIRDALIGLVVALLAFAIVNFVLKNVFSS